VFLLVPAHPGSPGQRAIKWLLLFFFHYRLGQVIQQSPSGSLWVAKTDFLGDRLENGSPYAIGPCYRSIACLSCPVCDVPALWPNGWTDQDETWHASRPRPWPHCVKTRSELV